MKVVKVVTWVKRQVLRRLHGNNPTPVSPFPHLATLHLLPFIACLA